MAEIGIVQVGVMTVAGEQLVMAAFFYDSPARQDEDAVGGFDRGKAVRDDNLGAVVQDEVERGLNL